MDILEGLNEGQLAAVMHNEGPLLVVAGAGTGKTQVIARRIGRLILESKAKPAQILALTFTDKAAREMRERLVVIIGYDPGVHVMTYNAFGSMLLHRFGSHVGRGTSGGLLGDDQKAMLLQQRISKLELRYYPPHAVTYSFAEKIADYISSLQNAGVTFEAYDNHVANLVPSTSLHQAEIDEQADLLQIFGAYGDLKRETETYDYADQVGEVVEIFHKRPNLAQRVGQEYAYILVDEYQDTSPIQDAMLRLIVPQHGNIFAVGDDDQAIYGFRGSDIANIQRFTEHFTVSEPVVLTQNYRSGQDILDASYRMIRNNDPDRLEAKLNIDKRLISQVGMGEIYFTPYASSSSELDLVVSEIKQLIFDGTAPAEIAVLARGKATLRAMAKVFRANNISFAMSAELTIFEQRELLNLWYLLQWIDEKIEDEAVGHIVTGPYIGWSLAEWSFISAVMKSQLIGAEEALKVAASSGNTSAKRLVQALENWREDSRNLNACDFVVGLVTKPSLVFSEALLDRLKSEAEDKTKFGRVIRVFGDFKVWFEHIQDYVSSSLLSSGDVSLRGYMNMFPKPPVIKVEEAIGEQDGVQLLTVHSSKGLEFDNIYIINATNRSWSEQPERGYSVPESLDTRSSTDPIAEQRRLMYVAVTRARKKVAISAAIASAAGQKQSESVFIGELFENHSNVVTSKSPDLSIAGAIQELERFYPFIDQVPARLPYEVENGWIQISVSDIDRFDKSPHDYLLERILGLNVAPGPQASFGTTIHGVIQTYYEQVLENLNPSSKDMLSRLDELWTDRGYSSKDEAQKALARAKKAIEYFVMRENQGQNSIIATERSIRFELPEFKLRLIGRVDAIYENDDGLEVRDFKTGVRNNIEKLQNEAKDSLQLRTYALALTEIENKTVTTVTLDHIVSGIIGSATLSPRILANHRTKLGILAGKLRAHDFHPGAPSEYNQAKIYRYFGTGEE